MKYAVEPDVVVTMERKVVTRPGQHSLLPMSSHSLTDGSSILLICFFGLQHLEDAGTCPWGAAYGLYASLIQAFGNLA